MSSFANPYVAHARSALIARTFADGAQEQDRVVLREDLVAEPVSVFRSVDVYIYVGHRLLERFDGCRDAVVPVAVRR